MDKLQKVKVTLGESELLFRAIFKQTFEFIGLMQLISIFIEGNQTALKFRGITSKKVVRCPLCEAYWSDFSRDVEDFFFYRLEALNFRQTFVEKLAQGLGILWFFPHNVKSQVESWTISKEIQAQLERIITRASRWRVTYGSQVKSFSNQSQKLIFIYTKFLQKLGIIAKVHDKVLVIFQIVEDCDRLENTNTDLAIIKKIVEISGGKIISDSQIGIGGYFLMYLV